MTKVYAVTGHRPGNFGRLGEFNHEEKLFNFAMKSIAELKPQEVLTGMAIGWDMAVADACLFLNVPYVTAIPFEGQEAKWSTEQKERYFFIRKFAKKELIFGTHFASNLYFMRNHWLVDNCDELLAMWDGHPKGGTYRTVEYAKKQGRPTKNLWSEYTQFLNLREA